jgi:hypothetical protein
MDEQSFGGGFQTELEPERRPTGDIGAPKATNERISVGSGDENVAKIQLAARWTEAYAPDEGDSLDEALRRFYHAYAYIDSVTHSVTPEGP